jgi:hypothetical protein
MNCLKNESSQGNDKILRELGHDILQALGALVSLIVRRPQQIGEFGK